MNKFTYKNSGVDIELGDDASRILYEASKVTWNNRKGKIGEIISPFDDFSGIRVFDVSNLPKGSLACLGFDGVGTKMEIAERIGSHETVAFDLFAMVCDDAVVRGGEPAVIGSVLDVYNLGSESKSHIGFIEQLAKGYIEAARESNVAVINGEIAELGTRINGFGDFNYSWSAGLLWFARKDRMFTGKEINVGDQIIGLSEGGFRSNGLSLLRKVLKEKYGENWHKKDFEGENLGKFALTPSKIYSKAVCEMTGGFADAAKAKVNGVAHITGGGLPGKLGRILRSSGYGAEISDPFEPCKLMLHAQMLGNVPDDEAYRTWNMGQGMVIVTPESQKVIRIAKAHNIKAKKIGEITEKPEIKIKSEGALNKSKTLIFGLK